MIVIAVTLLPEPDSPTMPSTLPRSSVERHAVDGADDAVLGRELDLEVLDLEQPLRHLGRPDPRVEVGVEEVDDHAEERR